MDAFEKHLSELKFQDPPKDLREKCLANIVADTDIDTRTKHEETPGFWTTWLWPHPKVWGGLAAIWFICFGLNQWTVSLPSYNRSQMASNPIDPEIQKITVLHYSLALDADNLDELLTPQTKQPEPEEETTRPKALIRRHRLHAII